MDTADQPTCGNGLAENAVLPARLGDLMAAMAENLAVHMTALDVRDPNSQVERDAYENLVRELQQSAARLQATANEMAGYRDLPMGKHDEAAMTQPGVRMAFEKFIQQKQELLKSLQQAVERDEQLLEMMRTHGQ